MRKILLSFIFIPIIAGQVAWGQTYHPFPDSNAVWNVLEFNTLGSSWNDSIWNNTFHYGFFGDTLINSLNYHKLFYNNGLIDSTIELSSSNTVYSGAIREEILSKIIYYIPKDSICEGILYDFDLSLHDTITIWGWNNLCCNDIDSMLINNLYRKVYYVWSITSMTGDYWIEGIGSLRGLLYPIYNPISNMKRELLCFYLNDTIVYHTDCSYCYWPIPSNLYTGGCYHQELYTSLPILNNNYNTKFIIYPNPVTDKSILKISSNFYLKNATVEIYNTQGILVKKVKIIEGNEIYLYKSEFNTGLYFLKIVSDNNVYTCKFIVQ